MTTLIQFTPPADAPFQFQATLDGTVYTCTVSWNIFREDWYLTVATVQGIRIFTLAMVASPPDYDISLTAGYFDTKLVFRAVDSMIEIG